MRTDRSVAQLVSRHLEIDNSIMPKRVSMRDPCQALPYGSNYAVDLAATAEDALPHRADRLADAGDGRHLVLPSGAANHPE